MDQLDDIQKSIVLLALDNLLISNKVLLEELRNIPDAKEHVEYMEFLDKAIPIIIKIIGNNTNTQGIKWNLLSKE